MTGFSRVRNRSASTTFGAAGGLPGNCSGRQLLHDHKFIVGLDLDPRLVAGSDHAPVFPLNHVAPVPSGASQREGPRAASQRSRLQTALKKALLSRSASPSDPSSERNRRRPAGVDASATIGTVRLGNFRLVAIHLERLVGASIYAFATASALLFINFDGHDGFP